MCWQTLTLSTANRPTPSGGSVPYWLQARGAASHTGQRVRLSPSASNPETHKCREPVFVVSALAAWDGALRYLGFDNAAVQGVVLLLVKQAELQTSQSGCGKKSRSRSALANAGGGVPQTLPGQPYWHHLSHSHSPPLLLAQAGAVEKLACGPPDWQMEQFGLQENLDWRRQVAFCPPGPEGAPLVVPNVRWLQREPTLRRKQQVRKVPEHLDRGLAGARGAQGGAAPLYPRLAGSAARSLEGVWRLTRVSRPSPQLLVTPEPHDGRQPLFLLSVPVVLSRATAAAAAAGTLRRQHITTAATAAAQAYFTSRDM